MGRSREKPKLQPGSYSQVMSYSFIECFVVYLPGETTKGHERDLQNWVGWFGVVVGVAVAPVVAEAPNAVAEFIESLWEAYTPTCGSFPE